MARKYSGGQTSFEKPDARGKIHITPITCMKMPESRSNELVYDETTGQARSIPKDTSLVVIVGSQPHKIPCTVEVFEEVMRRDYPRRQDLVHFLHQTWVSRPQGGKALAPVSEIMTVDDAGYEVNVLPTRASDYMMKFEVDLTTGIAYIRGCHFKYPPTFVANIANFLAGAKSLSLSMAVAGNKDLYVKSITPMPGDPTVVEVVIRSHSTDSDEDEIRKSGYLKQE